MNSTAESSTGGLYKNAEAKHVIGSNRWFPGDDEKNVKEVSISRKPLANEEPTVEHIEKIESPPKQSFFKRCWQKWWKHFKRWWCCYALGFIIFLAIFLPVLFLVIIPAIAQLIVDKTSLPIYGGAIVNPTPDSITFSIRSSLNIPKPITVALNPITLFLYNNDTKPKVPYSSVTLPEQKLKGNASITVTDQTAKISDMDEFKKFLQNAFLNKKVALSVFGNTTARLGALKAKIKMDKVVEIDGLDQLSGFGIQSARLLLPPKEDGTNLQGNISIPNHSTITLGLGNLTLNMLSGNLTIGQATLFNVVAEPGNNTFPCSGQIYLGTLIKNLPAILIAQADALRNGNIEISASGNSTINNGQHIEYLEYILNNIRLTTQVPILKLLVDSLGGLLQDSGDLLTDVLNILNNNTTSGLGDLLTDLNVTEIRSLYRRNVLLM